MFLGHFAMGVATKPAAPKMPVWILFTAPQFMDLLFIPMTLIGLEGFEQGSSYGHDKIDALYTHSLVGALLISALAYGLGRYFWKSHGNGLLLAGLSFSHWIVDLLVHHRDMPLLPGNLGDLPLLGLGLWNYEYLVFGVEVGLAIVAVALYFRWARQQRTARWYLGPSIVAVLFAAMVMMDIPRLPGF